jgi:acyl-CoA synthetase (NDP forming)
VITNAGGLGILCADACEAVGLELPTLAPETEHALAGLVAGEASLANPVDLLGSATAASYRAVIGPVLADPNIDALIVIFVPPVVAGAEEVAAAIREAVAAFPREKPVVAVVVSAEGMPASLRDNASPVVTLPYPESAARALALALERTRWLARPEGTLPALSGIDTNAARNVASGDDRWLASDELRALLGSYGIPLVPESVATSADEAVDAARALGFPAVVKTATPGAHKTDVGGVALDLRDEAAVRAAVDRIGVPVIVQPYLRGGTELLAGVVQDPVFGPLVAFGPGGAMAELVGEASFRIAPLTDLDAEELVHGGKAGRLVAGFRGAPAADAAALADVLLRLGRLAADLPEIAELDLNPILAGPDGCVAVDARVRVGTPAAPHRVKGW